MAVRFSRSIPADADAATVREAGDQVAAHLSAVVTADDNPDTRAGDVAVSVERGESETRVVGALDAAPDAPYLRAEFDPDSDTEHTYRPWQGVVS